MKIIQKAIKILEKLEKEKTEDVNKADSKRMTRDGDALVRSADKEAPLAPPAERTKAKFKLGSEEIELPDFGEKEDKEHNDYSFAQLTKAKAWVKEIERKNCDKIIAFRTPSGKSNFTWWKTGGPSALVLTYKYKPMLGKYDDQVMVDRDGYSNFTLDGTKSIQDIGRFKEDMHKIGVDVVAESDVICVFQLREEFTDSDLRHYRQEAGIHIKQAHGSTLKEVKRFPEIEQRIVNIGKIATNYYRHDDAKVQSLITRDYTRRCLKMFIIERGICTGRRGELRGFSELAEEMDYVGEGVYILAEMGFRDKKQVMALTRETVPLRAKIMKKLEELENDDA